MQMTVCKMFLLKNIFASYTDDLFGIAASGWIG